MFPIVLVTITISHVSVVERLDRHRRDMYGYEPAYFEKRIKPLVTGMTQAKKVTLHEGLPRQSFAEQLRVRGLTVKERAAELKEKKAVEFHHFPFYEELIAPKDAKALLALCADVKTFGRFIGEKSCGGYHSDWWLKLKDGDAAYHVLICFGCHEARLYGPDGELYSDLDEAVYKKFDSILNPLHKNLPKDAEKKDPAK